MRRKILNTISSLADKHTLKMFFGIIIITLIFGQMMEKLELQMHFKNLMPESHPIVEEFDTIIEEYSTATMIIVAAQGEEKELKEFADELAPKLETFSEFVKRVDYKLNREFMENHGFILTKEKNLKNMKDLFSDLRLLPFITHINDNFEKTYVYDEDGISNKEKENEAIRSIEGIEFWIKTMKNYILNSKEGVEAKEAVERFLIGDEYMISQDKDMLLLFAQPTFSLNEIDKVVLAENKIDSLIASVAEKYPSVYAGTTGTMALARDEMVAANEDAYFTSLIAFILIIALFILSFRMWVAPILAGITLIIGIVMAGGFAAITIGSLNVMTSMFSVILIGLGVDFSIHIISGYTENRSAGLNNFDALKTTLNKSGVGVITGGFTTACAFLTLTISETAGMREFGIVAGSGVIFCMISTLIVLPVLLSLRDKILNRVKGKERKPKSIEFNMLGALAEGIAAKPIIFISVFTLITLFLIFSASRITFDYNYLNMEPVGLTSIKLQDVMEEKFDVTPDFALVSTQDVSVAREISKGAKKLKMVGMVTSVTDYLPSEEEYRDRIPHVLEIKNNLSDADRGKSFSEREIDKLIEELYRIEDNFIELGQLSFIGGQDKVDKKCKAVIGDIEDSNRVSQIEELIELIKLNPKAASGRMAKFEEEYIPHLKEMAFKMANTKELSLQDLPEDIRDQFVSEDGSHFLVTIYPKEGVWKDLQFLQRFTERMHELDSRTTGMPSIFYILIGIIGNDGKIAALLTVVVVFLLLLWDFRSVKYAVMAMVPLIIGVIWMVGIMQLFGLQLTILNVIGIPLILGIGIDDGVHILHRYRIEGKTKLGVVFNSTGKAVLLTSVTTMLAFGSLVFATYRGLGSMGLALFIGVGTCFLASVTILPAIIGLVEKGKRGVK